MERLSDHNYNEYKKKFDTAVEGNEKKMKYLAKIITNATQEEPQKISQIENMNKLHHYRELKRNRDAKDISAFNHMSFRDSKMNLSNKRSLNIDSYNADGTPTYQTGLLW